MYRHDSISIIGTDTSSAADPTHLMATPLWPGNHISSTMNIFHNVTLNFVELDSGISLHDRPSNYNVITVFNNRQCYFFHKKWNYCRTLLWFMKKNTFLFTTNAIIFLNPVVATACTTDPIVEPPYPVLLNQVVVVSYMKGAGIILLWT